MARKLAIGNWKMNGVDASLVEVEALLPHVSESCDIVICPPATLISRASELMKDKGVKIGAQCCHPNASGAHTGDISASMLSDAGAEFVIVGHSERRLDHGETDADIAAQLRAAQAQGMVAILCVGETESEREDERTLEVITGQLQNSLSEDVDHERLVIAYEPVWAIGTGKTPTIDQIAQVHDHIRLFVLEYFGQTAKSVSLLYGGSVKPANASEIFEIGNVNGALVGGASLKAVDFSQIIDRLAAS